MSRLKWEREGSGYDIQYSLYSPNGLLIAQCYRGGSKWYPWSWWMKDSSKRHGEATTLKDAKDCAEQVYLSSLT